MSLRFNNSLLFSVNASYPQGCNNTMSIQKLDWRVHTHGLLKEILSDPQNRMLEIPLNIMLGILREVAQRAVELNDAKMNECMIRLGLYSISNPDDPEYDPVLVSKILGKK